MSDKGKVSYTGQMAYDKWMTDLIIYTCNHTPLSGGSVQDMIMKYDSTNLYKAYLAYNAGMPTCADAFEHMTVQDLKDKIKEHQTDDKVALNLLHQIDTEWAAITEFPLDWYTYNPDVDKLKKEIDVNTEQRVKSLDDTVLSVARRLQEKMALDEDTSVTTSKLLYKEYGPAVIDIVDNSITYVDSDVEGTNYPEGAAGIVQVCIKGDITLERKHFKSTTHICLYGRGKRLVFVEFNI